jgi:hypothetical protein
VRVARHPLAATLLPAVESGHIVPVGRVKQKDGTEQSFHFEHFLGAAQAEDRDEFDRVFLGGSLLALGDALHGHDYFDHAPELELVYHLRNGVAHGNHFNIRASGVARLSKWPAHNRLAWVRSQSVTFEVTTGLNGQEVLWGYLEPGDVVALFQAVGLYLVRRGNGDPVRP